MSNKSFDVSKRDISLFDVSNSDVSLFDVSILDVSLYDVSIFENRVIRCRMLRYPAVSTPSWKLSLSLLSVLSRIISLAIAAKASDCFRS
jgi:hypothetical protein